MNKCTMTAGLAALLLVTGMSITASAQDRPLGKVGLGVTLGTGQGATSQGRFGVLVPLNLVPNLRIEPIVGFNSSSTTVTPPNGGTETSMSETGFTVGVGGFYTYRPSGVTNIYAGARLALSATSTENDNGMMTTGTSRNDIIIEPVVGGEYHFSPHFALGAEFQIPVTIVGETEQDPAPMGPQAETSTTRVGTAGALVARFYFY